MLVTKRSGESADLNAGTALTPGKTIRAYCLHCVGGNAQDVRACDANDQRYHVCPFHPYRLGKGKPSVKTIRKFCLDCMGGSSNMVADCQTEDCYCHPYRFGKTLAVRRGRTAEQMSAMRARKQDLIKEKAVKI